MLDDNTIELQHTEQIVAVDSATPISSEYGELVKTRSIIGYRNGEFRTQDQDDFLCETPVAMVYNGISYAVMMCSAADLEDFAVGFSLTEGIIDHHRDIHDIQIDVVGQGVEIRVELANRCVARLKAQRRNMAGRTGCGICGTEQLDMVTRPLPAVDSSVAFSISLIDGALAQLQQHQTLNQLTGASHAAAYVSASGELLVVKEDIGRHIALDKLIGYVHRHNLSGGAVLVTSRASFEMVQKTASAGIEVLLAISAASDLAVRLADKWNITLAGFCRSGRATIYTHADRLMMK